MNVGGGEAADQMVRMMLSGTEVAVRLSGSALKNLLALSLALARNHKASERSRRSQRRQRPWQRRSDLPPRNWHAGDWRAAWNVCGAS